MAEQTQKSGGVDKRGEFSKPVPPAKPKAPDKKKKKRGFTFWDALSLGWDRRSRSKQE